MVRWLLAQLVAKAIIAQLLASEGIMKDVKAEWGSQQQKLEQAIGYLKEKGIWRGSSTCQHRYRNSDGRVVIPVRKLMPGGF